MMWYSKQEMVPSDLLAVQVIITSEPISATSGSRFEGSSCSNRECSTGGSGETAEVMYKQIHIDKILYVTDFGIAH